MENIEHKASVVSSINWYHEVYFFFFIAAFAAFDVFVISGNTIKKNIMSVHRAHHNLSPL